jgi:N-acetylmuramoyl-L-alanine amidase
MLTLSDPDFMALTMWAEARGEPVEGRIAIGCVLRNRLNDGRWGSSYERVCLAPAQFSCWNSGTDANHAALLALCAQVQSGTPITDAILTECYWIASGVRGQQVLDRVDRATHYLRVDVNPQPKWVSAGTMVCRIGPHVFFSGVK